MYSCPSQTDLPIYLLYPSCTNLVVEYINIFIFLRGPAGLCINGRAGIVLFALLGIADARALWAEAGSSPNRAKLSGVVFVYRCTWNLSEYING